MAIYIPNKIKVGYQKREDTFTGKLAYVIYFDSFGKLRKETSWQGWRHKDIEPQEFENTPVSGFFLNKGIRRFNWNHFGSGRSMIRIHDPRGFEFEVTPENLIGLLMHADCMRREVQCDLVYAWNGGELMLLPTSSEEYLSAKTFTELQAKKVGAKELVEGATYITKQEDKIVYLGRHMYYEFHGYEYSDGKAERIGKKQHMFRDAEGKKDPFPVKSVIQKIGAVISETPHENAAMWIKEYLEDNPKSQAIVAISVKNMGEFSDQSTAYKVHPEGFVEQASVEYAPQGLGMKMYIPRMLQCDPGWYMSFAHTRHLPNGSRQRIPYSGSYYRSSRYEDYRHITEEELRGWGNKLYATLANGKVIEWR